MKFYMASPVSQLQADTVRGYPVLMSFAVWRGHKYLTDWLPSFSDLLIDSGAYSVLKSGVNIDLPEYIEWAESLPWADAYAGLDHIEGDWKLSLKNYESGGFPTMHDTDPPELLEDLIEIARVNCAGWSSPWVGVGLKPPRQGKEHWVREVMEKIPDDIHVHGWALGAYTHVARIDSIDSTHWWREAMKYRTKMPWLTYGETLEIAVKKCQRFSRMVEPDNQGELEL